MDFGLGFANKNPRKNKCKRLIIVRLLMKSPLRAYPGCCMFFFCNFA